MRKIQQLLFTSLLVLSIRGNALATTTVNLEFGQASSAYNDVKIDGETGTLFNLSPALDSTSYHRLGLITKFKSGNGIRLLYAPLKFTGSRRFSQDIDFNGVNFSSSQTTDVTYQFNSYRGTYFSEVVSKKNFLLRLGGTLKVRDALIKLKQSDRYKFKKNTGLVPLLYLYSEYKVGNDYLIALDFDGLMAPQGRAFDVALMAGYRFSPATSLQLGYRVLEGGADNENVYNFSQINYYFTALQMSF